MLKSTAKLASEQSLKATYHHLGRSFSWIRKSRRFPDGCRASWSRRRWRLERRILSSQVRLFHALEGPGKESASWSRRRWRLERRILSSQVRLFHALEGPGKESASSSKSKSSTRWPGLNAGAHTFTSRSPTDDARENVKQNLERKLVPPGRTESEPCAHIALHCRAPPTTAQRSPRCRPPRAIAARATVSVQLTRATAGRH
mmetsp:Transcript_57594/g.178836  ORF Transcript_57594/g.178836 Transcript_57594/m.178836 type:complete len:202 (-) Transcript_57594:24-629(-)